MWSHEAEWHQASQRPNQNQKTAEPQKFRGQSTSHSGFYNHVETEDIFKHATYNKSYLPQTFSLKVTGLISHAVQTPPLKHFHSEKYSYWSMCTAKHTCKPRSRKQRDPRLGMEKKKKRILRMMMKRSPKTRTESMIGHIWSCETEFQTGCL